jgi:hypothetical protein
VEDDRAGKGRRGVTVHGDPIGPPDVSVEG